MKDMMIGVDLAAFQVVEARPSFPAISNIQAVSSVA